MNYYNDNDQFVCEWLKNLIAEKIIPQGDVDGRSILEINGKELRGYQQCHFFAGVGGWPIALGLAGWGARDPVWTGSCPCQPFSVAGNGEGEKDERHLWPQFFRLIKKCKPPTIFGEQVASEDGRDWLSAVRLDLEALGYAVGGADLCAAGVGAPHVRQRLWWVADLEEAGREDTQGGKRPTEQNGREINVSNYVGRRLRQWVSEPEMVRVVDGVLANPRAVGAYGNSIVPQVGAQFISSFMEAS